MDTLYHIIYSVFIFLLGLVIGSFLNVCIYRVPQGISVVKGRSYCPYCEAQISAKDNIPLVSYLMLRGKCRSCGEKISPQYFFVELLTGIGFLLTWLRFGAIWLTPIYFAFTAVLIFAAFVDIETQEIPDRTHIIILGLAMLAFFLAPETLLWWERLLGAVVISLPMFLIALLTGGFGMGDVKLMAASGLLLGWKAMLFAGFLGCILAALFAVILIAQKKKSRKDKIAFGPFLAAALFIAALYATNIITAYFSLFSIRL